ncbi:hypothetical protein GCM10023330_14030 [Litoribaculum gwangyangense]|uniref:Uncharacterized protein n=1 Tax=Litoribaculum gwangyangense TaxID=1130722 RepID=A0ABP9CGN2_9FLAO
MVSDKTPIDGKEYAIDDHEYPIHKPELALLSLSQANDSLKPIIPLEAATEVAINTMLFEEFRNSHNVYNESPVANKIVENYLNSENKEPDGHCLSVSKGRFEKAYKEVYGHLFYQDLPDSMASRFHSPKQVFDMLYASASDTYQGWRSLPEKYRGKGNAGAIAYAGMGTLIDSTGIWGGALKPGALMQVWRYEEDYEKVVQGVNVKKLDPYGHSFIFISYVCNEKNDIIGLEIADQGFQSYRPILPRDYEVWWAVNLSI